MEARKHTLIALYDAAPEHAHFESPVLASHARALGKALTDHHMSTIARIGSSVVGTVMASVGSHGGSAIALSPAARKDEHHRAFRLPFPTCPIIYTGRGATGADMMALASAQGILIIGSYPHVLESILDQARDIAGPIGILTDEEVPAIHERVRTRHPQLVAGLFVSHDPEILVRDMAGELRRRELSAKLG